MLGAYYDTKKDLKASIGEELRFVETSIFGNEYKPTGRFAVVGPDPYTNRKWYAEVTMKAGKIIKVE